jgi:TolB-like protein/tetratricopeptide (TPR) repeat protein
MKRCPECRRDYYDDSLLYCLDDGSALLEGPATAEPRTLTMPHLSGGSYPSFLPQADVPTLRFELPRSADLIPPNSVAVMPFTNIGGDKDLEYFSDGLAEELLNVLSKIKGLRVAARASSFSFKKNPGTVTEIGRSLHVASVVEGSIRMSGRRMRISVQLVKVEDGYHLWSDTYDRTMDDIFAVQDDIAHSVVNELRALLVGEEAPDEIGTQILRDVAEATRGRSDDPEAQRLMLLGRYFLDRTTAEDARKAIEHFKEAVELDPDFALCWAEMGRAYSVQVGKAWTSVDDGFRLSRQATEKALELEPELAEGHAQLGRIFAANEWDLAAARREYQRALDLAPGNSVVMDGASILEFKLGNFERALELSRQVLMQDPLSGAVWHNLGLICHAAGLVAEAEKALRRAMELSPQRLVTLAMLALVLMDEGRTEDALETAATEPDEFWRLWAFSILYHLTGRSDEAQEALNALIEKGADGGAYQIAEVYAARGNSDEAFEWLERAVAERDPGVTHAGVSPRFRTLHADPRWQGLLKVTGLKAAGAA